MYAKKINVFIISVLCTFVSFKSIAQSCITITEPPAVMAGTATNANVCQATTGATVITLNNNLTSEDSGGAWSLAPSSPNPAAAFDGITGIFDPNNVAAGTYIFRYTVGTTGCEDTEDVEVIIQNCCPPKACSPVKVTKI